MTVIAWWLFLFGVWPLAHPQHGTFGDPMTIADLLLHVTGTIVLGTHYWVHRRRVLDQTIGCTFGAHGSCTGWGDASRRHGIGAQVRCTCRCHADRWEVLR